MARNKPQLWQQVQDSMTKRALEEITNSILDGAVPSGTIIIWDQGPSCPIGYRRDDTYAGVFMKGAESGLSPGATGGAATATTSADSSNLLVNTGTGGGYSLAVAGHSHTVGTLPPFKEVLFCRKL